MVEKHAENEFEVKNEQPLWWWIAVTFAAFLLPFLIYYTQFGGWTEFGFELTLCAFPLVACALIVSLVQRLSVRLRVLALFLVGWPSVVLAQLVYVLFLVVTRQVDS